MCTRMLSHCLTRGLQSASAPPRMLLQQNSRCYAQMPAVHARNASRLVRCNASRTAARVAQKPVRIAVNSSSWGSQPLSSTSRSVLQGSRSIHSSWSMDFRAAASSASDAWEEITSYEEFLEGAAPEDKPMPKEEREYWEEVLGKLRRRPAIEATALLNMSWRLGMSSDFDGRKKPNGFDLMVLGKTRRPYAVILVKVGKFYEAAGMDAILLVEHCGLNFMGRNLSAGCPLSNIHQVLNQLVREAGLQVAVWEEVGDLSGGKKKRAEAQLVTPENPQYLYNFAESLVDVDVGAPTICGVSTSSRGYDVFKYSYPTNSIIVHEGLSFDGVWGVINADRCGRPIVYQHWLLDTPRHEVKSHASQLHLDALNLKQHLGTQDILWKSYESADPVHGFMQQLCKAKGWPADTVIGVQQADVSVSGVRCLFFTTASQLGLTALARGVPVLVDYLVPEAAAKVVRDTLTSLLTAPPSHAVAAATRQVVRLLMALDEPLPNFAAGGVTTPKKVLLVLGAKEANARFFHDLKGGLEPVVTALSPGRSHALAALVDTVWPLLLHTTDSPAGTLTQEQVLVAAEWAVEAVDRLVASSDPIYQQQSSTDSSGSDDEGRSGSSGKRSRKKAAEEVPIDATYVHKEANKACDELGELVELWSKRVSAHAIRDDVLVLCEEGEGYTAVMNALLRAAIDKLRQHMELTPRNCPSLVVDSTSSAVWLRVPSDAARKALVGVPLHLKYGTTLDAPNQLLRRPTEQRGKRRGGADVFTCNALDIARAKYLNAVQQANAAATAVLKALAADMSQYKVELAAAMQLGILLVSLLEHSRAATAAGWSVPLVGSKEQQEALGGGSSSSSSSPAHPEHDGVLKLQQLWPYWMSGGDPTTVKNDIELQGMMLLTGPNMAGKSTVLRAVAAAALAGSVGLAIPAAPGSQLPLLDAVMLRTFSGDAPQEGLSAFGVEMREMRTVLSDVRPSSLVLVDELGKGTEVISGTALASGILRQLAASGAMGVFATHLHLLVDLLKDVPHLSFFKMDVERQTGADSTAAAVGDSSTGTGEYDYLYGLRPTWKLLPGTCFETLAFAVARDCGLPPAVLATAQAEYHLIMNDSHSLVGYDNIMRVVREGKGSAGSSMASSSSPLVSMDSSCDEFDVMQLAAASDGDDSDDFDEDAGSAPPPAPPAPPATEAKATVSFTDAQEGVGQLEDFLSRRHGMMLRRLHGADSSGGSSSSVAVEMQAARAQVHALFAQFMHMLVPPGPADAARRKDAAARTAAAAAGPEPGPCRRRRRRSNKQQQQQPPPEEVDSGSGPAVSQAQEVPPAGEPVTAADAGVQLGRVHELCAGSQPPPAHEGTPIVYALRNGQGWFYLGESQGIRRRVSAHRRNHGHNLTMWYVLLSNAVDRKVVQGRMIQAAQQLDWPLWSSRDAALARRK